MESLKMKKTLRSWVWHEFVEGNCRCWVSCTQMNVGGDVKLLKER